MTHPRRQLHAGVEVQRRPRRIDRRRNPVTAVDFAERAAVGRHLQPRRKVAAARFDRNIAGIAGELLPEAEHRGGSFRRFFRAELLLVEQAPGDPPRFRAEAHPVREPDVVIAEVMRETAELPPQKRAERRPLRNPLRETGVRLRIGAQRRGADHETVRIQSVRLRDFGMFAVFERRHREFGAVVEGRADPDRFSTDFGSGFAEHRDQPLQPAIGARRGVGAKLHRPQVGIFPRPLRKTGGRIRIGIGDAVPVIPLQRRFGIPGVFKDFAAVGDPQQHRDLFGPVGQRLPLGEQLPRHPPEFGIAVVAERLCAQFERHILQLHGYLRD